MALCVVDASFALQWFIEDEATPAGDAALAAIRLGGAAVPHLWAHELANAFGMAERRGRMTRAAIAGALSILRALPLVVEEIPLLEGTEAVHDLMRAYRLTAYDAAYLHLAIRLQLPLATLDRRLATSADASGVPRFAAAV